MYRLVAEGTLDTNSPYAYLLYSTHYCETTLVPVDASGALLGFVMGHRPPTHPETYFVWQIGVDEAARGQGIAGKLLMEAAKRQSELGVRFVEATVTPDNVASRRSFEALARGLACPCQVTESFFPADSFPPGSSHAPEDLYRIGPFSEARP